jgi:hypothetical protein
MAAHPRSYYIEHAFATTKLPTLALRVSAASCGWHTDGIGLKEACVRHFESRERNLESRGSTDRKDRAKRLHAVGLDRRLLRCL